MKALVAAVFLGLAFAAQAQQGVVNFTSTACNPPATYCSLTADTGDLYSFTYNSAGNVVFQGPLPGGQVYTGIAQYGDPTTYTLYRHVWPVTVQLDPTGTLLAERSAVRSGSGVGGWAFHYHWLIHQFIFVTP